MPLRRPTTSLTLEELLNSDSDEGGILGSDDELDTSARVVKRRRIEKLGESYLQGKPLFISSASLRGPFDGGWVNPWKKQRKHLQDLLDRAEEINSRRKANHVEKAIIPETDIKKRRSGVNAVQMTRQTSSSFSERAYNDRIPSEASPLRATSVASRASPNNQRKQRRSLPWGNNHTLSTNPETTSSDTMFRNDWLKKDRKIINIRDVDPPKSPTPLYVSRRNSVEQVRKRSSHSESDHISLENPCLWPKSLSGIKKIRTPRGVLPHAYQVSGDSSREYNHYPAHRRIQNETQQSYMAKKQGQGISAASQSPGNSPIAPTGQDRPTTGPADNFSRRSSVYRIPPSSHLPEFEYRRPRNAIRSEQSVALTKRNRSEAGDDDLDQEAKSRNVIAMEEIQDDSDAAHHLSDPKHVPAHPNYHSDQSVSTRHLTSIGSVVGTVGPGNPTSNSTGSERIPSAQVLSGILGLSDRFTSLHSTEVHVERCSQNNSADDDAQLSTQTALLLAQQSFQDDLVTPEKVVQPMSTGNHQDLRPSSRKITPFAQINTTPQTAAITSKNEEFQTLNTQAMINAMTPFNFSTSKKADHWTEPRSRLSGRGSSSKRRKKTSFVEQSSPSRSVFSGPDVSVQRQGADIQGESSQMTVTKVTQPSLQELSHALPLAFSGSTPTTDQQDGQRLISGMDSFNISQVIQDAGSWLQQSWDVERDLKRCSRNSTQSSAHRPTMNLGTLT